MDQRAGQSTSSIGQPHAQLLAAYLAMQPSACPSCKAVLHELRGADCPQCGQGLRLRLSLESPNNGAFLFGLCGLAGGLGFAVLALLITTYEAVFSSFEREQFLAFGAMAAVFLLLFVVWFKSARTIRRCHAIIRWSLAVVCALLPLLGLICVLAFLR